MNCENKRQRSEEAKLEYGQEDHKKVKTEPIKESKVELWEGYEKTPLYYTILMDRYNEASESTYFK
jgi:hypothetical protein